MFEAKNSKLTIVVTAALFVAFALVDYATPLLMRTFDRNDSAGQWIVALAIGVCVAQVTLIAAWAVFAPGNIVVRLPWALLLGLMMWYVLALSETRASPWNHESATAELGINILYAVTALQVPLWIAKRSFRYRMIPPGEVLARIGDERLQFELKHLLVGTLLFAVALSPLRFVVPREGFRNFDLEWQMIVVVGIAIVANLFATLPCLWGGFVSNASIVPLSLGWLVYCSVVTGLEFAALCAATRAPPDPYRDFCLFYVANISQCAVVFGAMRAYRALGYRLRRVPHTMPPPESIALAWEKELVEVDPRPDAIRAEQP